MDLTEERVGELENRSIEGIQGWRTQEKKRTGEKMNRASETCYITSNGKIKDAQMEKQKERTERMGQKRSVKK